MNWWDLFLAVAIVLILGAGVALGMMVIQSWQEED